MENSRFLTLPSFPSLALFLAAVVPEMSFISTSPPMPDEQTFLEIDAKNNKEINNQICCWHCSCMKPDKNLNFLNKEHNRSRKLLSKLANIITALSFKINVPEVLI